MKFKEFVERSKDTMIYPSHKELITCMTFGIIEEHAEIEEVAHQELFHAQSFKQASTYREDVISELGDFCFYVFGLSHYFGYEPQNSTGEEFILHIHAPILAKIIKKTIRDDDYQLSDPNRIDKFKWVMDCALAYILYICKLHDLDLEHVLDYNVEKLQGRKSRNTISGDGER